MNSILRNIFLATVFFMAPLSAEGKAVLPSFFSNNMVLQQKSNVPVWGTTAAGATVKVISSWDKKSYTSKADKEGNWSVTLKTPSYGGPYSVSINDGDYLVLENILIGEVWLCSGQSNMEMPLDGWGKINNYEEEIRNAAYPQIRLLQATHTTSATPLNDLKIDTDGWQVCSPSTISNFSSTAYFFAKKIYEEKHIPIGLLHSSWGGTVIEAWISKGALKEIHDFDIAIKVLESVSDKEALKKQFDADSKVWNATMEKAERGNNGKWETKEFDYSNWKTMQLPQFWENDALVGFDGVAWFKKEFNLPTAMKGKDLQLNFYADDDDKLWVNGVYIGTTSGYNVLRNYTIPANVLKESGNVIAIRVTDNTGGGGIYGKETDLILKGGNESFSLAGKWYYAVGVDFTELPVRPYLPADQNQPTVLYNAMIHPLIKLPIAGAIWYQGESNADRAYQYQTLFPMLISDWRNKFGIKDMPFYFVQLTNYMKAKDEPGASAWAELREAQFKTLLNLKNTGMAVITDIGDAGDIHPKNKQDVGYRLARIALSKIYGIPMSYSGPLYKSFNKKGSDIIVSFTFNETLKSTDCRSLKGFSIAGKDKVFHWAEAKVVGNTIVVSSEKVKDPVAVRYNWADNPDGNLTNSSGLPASSFRTDDWQGITFGNK
ncbi:sialate O-acetylesterase [Flavobacterium suzhouense]|uniref:Sialate O-acetylesterase n=1 Tax=Flavobacterium suzhouense TaxID=1529638 RepID=A0ABW5NX69_9FLAO